MPHILVVAEADGDDTTEVVLTERLAPTMLDSEHYGAQLLERVRWAVEDARDVEQDRDRARR
jgi:hypothetical protein